MCAREPEPVHYLLLRNLQQFYLLCINNDLISDLSCKPTLTYKTHSYTVMQFVHYKHSAAQTRFSQTAEQTDCVFL